MELWIRSQDKMTLSRINNIKLVEYNSKYSLVGYCERELDDFDLGIYSTKERALEVLDEIQKLLQPQMVLSKVGKLIAETCDGTVYREPDEYDIKELSTYVYEMPKD